MSDIDTAVVDSLKVIDLKWPIREADMPTAARNVRFGGKADLPNGFSEPKEMKI